VGRDRPAFAGEIDGRPGRPYSADVVRHARALFEDTWLTSAAIAAQVGVCAGTASRWARLNGWTRPPGAPRANDTFPSARARAWLARRAAADRAQATAAGLLAALESSDAVDLDGLARALDTLATARALRAAGVRKPGCPAVPYS
jgi:hypothetical protein